jgi:hypothetical protein
MNRAMTLIAIVFFIIFVTLLADSLGLATTTNIAGQLPQNIERNATSVFSVLNTFFAILTFRLVGVPFVINLLLFVPITFGTVYLILEIVKDVIPFT